MPLVLGSATPSLESWQRPQAGEYRLLELPRRVLDRPLPEVATIDLRIEFSDRRSRGAISRQLHQAMSEALADGGQVILLLNRRGFSTHIQCPACGYVVQCPQLRHRADASPRRTTGALPLLRLRDAAARRAARTAASTASAIGGLGTQRLEAEVRPRFPDVPCLRMDTDTMQKPGSHEEALRAFPRRRGPDPARHADDRQGARLSRTSRWSA